MTKPVLCFLFLWMAALCSFGQTASIKGTVIDTSENRNLAHSVISLLRQKDSVLVSFTRSDSVGAFRLAPVAAGAYIIMVTYPGYADYVDLLQVKDSAELILDSLILTPRSTLLEAVIVRQQVAAIRMKGDTLEYKADSFKVGLGANVEELLKKLPGLQVDKNGQITAQGEKVQKILVDGEEFFSDDPAVVTQNLRADAVDKVQVFDKKSDQANFTGIDDGQRSKTINITLKENRKRGIFGKLKAGGGNSGYFENESMINAFKGKRQLSVFGTIANTGKAGLDWRDEDKYGGGNGVEYNEDDDTYYIESEPDNFNTWGGHYYGQGLPTAWTGGAHFANKWKEDKDHVNGNYRYYKQDLDISRTTQSRYILPDTQYFNNQTTRSFNQNIRHSLDGYFEWATDSSSSLKLTVYGADTKGRSQGDYYSEALTADSELVNKSRRLLHSDGEKQTFNANLLWRKKFAKKGRTLSINVQQSYNSDNTDGYLNSRNDFYNATGSLSETDSIDQEKLAKNDLLTLNSKVSYTEPISAKAYFEFSYGFRTTHSESQRSSFNKSVTGKYDLLDTLYSNDYDYLINTHTGGINLRVNGKKLMYSFGGAVSYAGFRQKDLGKDSRYRYSFVNFFPQASFRYIMSPQHRLQVSYRGSTRTPTLNQLQPIQDNTDPLNIQLGNPDLKQEFRHQLSLRYNNFQLLKNRSIYFSAGENFYQNAISLSSTVDSVGKRTNRFVNVNGNNNFSFWGGYWMQLKKWHMSVNFNAGGNFSRYNNFVNGVKNTNTNRSWNGAVSFYYDKDKKFSLRFNPQVSRTYSRSSSRPDVVTQYWESRNELDGDLHLPWKLALHSDLLADYR